MREDGSVVLRVTDARGTSAERSTGASGRVAGYAGIFRCGNVHLCLECSTKIAVARAQEIERVVGYHVARGGWAVLVTLTLRHYRHHSLAQCLKAASAGWAAVTSGGAWQADKKLSDYAGYCRALEVTESPANGWHGHFHVILVFRSRPSETTVEHIAEGMFRRWSAAVQREGMPAPSRECGLDVQHLDDRSRPGEDDGPTVTRWARYVAKGIAAESALGITKDARGSNRSVRQLMRDALIPQGWENPETHEVVETVDQTALTRLREYQAAIKGRRAITWSTGRHDLRKAAGEQESLTDEEIVRLDLEGEDVAVLPRESWKALEPRAVDLLSVTEVGGKEAARAWLDAQGIEWWRPTRLTHHYRRGDSR
ncbi:MAG: protein rep [Dehalococcoidia bacterium]